MPKTIDYWSLRSVPIKLLANGQVLGSATGFFWLEGDEASLITNWHVVSGRDPITMAVKSCWEPEEISYPRFIEGASYEEIVEDRVRLVDPCGKALWLHHPVHGSSVDVAAISVPVKTTTSASGNGEKVAYVNPINSPILQRPDYGLHIDMGEDLFILGFPLNLKPTGHFPIWKRASVATEMDILLNGKRAFLVDTATREGMSGSPVLQVRRWGTNPIGGPSEIRRSHSFVGIYSGRHIGKTEIEAQLGIVWKMELIHEIVVGKCRGTVDLSRLP